MTRTVFVVPHTHWDREWYQPYELFRWRLVQMIDELLDHMEQHPEYRCFNLDGQSIVIADYLELRPENERRLRALIEAGRIVIGPWWVQPDEFLPTGESHIRSFQMGIRYAEKLGGSLRIGHCADQFGHIAQMPQIMAQLGLTSACLWRGVPDSVRGWSFHWEAPDGTRLPVLYLRNSYSSGWRLPSERDALHERTRAEERGRRDGEPALLMNGTDHSRMEKHVPGALDGARGDEFDYRLGTLADYEAAMLEAGIDPHVHRGELRSSDNSNVLVGVLSARMNLKQRDFQVQSLLERIAEPLELLSHLHGGPNGLPALKQAWRLALENSPHDSICGCSVDQVHREMLPRYDRAEQLATQVARESLAHLVLRTGVPAPGAVAVFRPVPHALVTLETWVPASWDAQSLELPGGTRVPVSLGPIEDGEVLAQGETTPAELARHLDFLRDGRYENYAIESITPLRVDSELQLLTRVGDGVNHVDEDAIRSTVSDLLKDPVVESGAYVVQRSARRKLRALLPASDSIGVDFAVPSSLAPTQRHVLRTGKFAIGNEFHDVIFDGGRLIVRDRQLRLRLLDQLWYVDQGDRGDEYNADILDDTGLVAEDTTLLGIERDGVSATMRLLTLLDVPASLTKDRTRRRRSRFDFMAIFTNITVWAGLRRVDFDLEVENTARDHRLRLLFPLPFRTDEAITEGHFHVATRRLHAPQWNGRSAELPPTTFPQKSFVAFERDGAGMAVFNRGLPEGEVEELSDGRQAYALTLLRSVGWLSRDDLVSRRGHAGPQIATQDSQMTGRHRFAFALTTYGGDWRSAGILPMSHSFAHQPFAVSTNAHDGYPAPAYPLATFDSAGLVPSAVHRSHESGLPIVRAYSATDTPASFGVSVPNVAGHRRVDLLERDTTEWSGGGDATLQLRPWEIASLRFDRHGGA